MTRPRDGGVRVRFGAAPGGPLNLAAARIALAGWLLARRHGGRFVLRIDDLDPPPAAGHEAALEQDLRWPRLDWDAPARQSDRRDRYEAAIARLQASGRLYP